MDHSDIRGLGTALHLFLAGLPRSKSGDHPKNGVRWCSHKSVEDSPHRSHASRSQLGVLLEVKMLSDCAPVEVVGVEEDLGADLHLTRHIPDEAGELPSDGDADFVLRKLSPHCKTPPAFRQAQLRFPGDLTDDLRLSFLANLEASGDLRFEAIIPRGLHQDTSGVFIARFGDLALATGLACGELRGHQSEVRFIWDVARQVKIRP